MTLQALINEYRQSHENPTNQLIHFFCVPLIVFSTLALAWSLNLGLIGIADPAGRWLNLATVGGSATLVYYATLGLRPLLGMLLFTAPLFAAILGIEALGLPLLWIAGAVFVGAWAAQLYGHEVEGAKPSFMKDMQFMLIGPLFVLDEWGFRLHKA